MRLGKPTFVVFAAILMLPIAGLGQEPESTAPTLKVYARETIVDVNVTDASGNPVRGLKRSDFTVEENGKPQAIHSFEEFDQGPPPPPAPPLRLALNEFTNAQPLPETGPVNMILLDTLNVRQPVDLVHEQQAVEDLSRQDAPRHPDRHSPALARRPAHAPVLHLRSPRCCAAPCKPICSTSAATLKSGRETGTAVDAIDQIAAYVASIKGRKNLLWFIPGMPIALVRDGGYSWSDPDVGGGWTVPDMGVVYRLMDAYELLTAEQIALYPVDPRGVGGLGMATMRAVAVADDLGGVAYYNTNDLGSAIASAIDHGSHFYTISYFPPHHDDGHFHSIHIAADLPGLRLVYRKGYNAELPQMHPPTSGPSLMKASLEARLPNATQLLFDVRVKPGTPPG